jgi:hypothetical protein
VHASCIGAPAADEKLNQKPLIFSSGGIRTSTITLTEYEQKVMHKDKLLDCYSAEDGGMFAFLTHPTTEKIEYTLKVEKLGAHIRLGGVYDLAARKLDREELIG